MRKRAPALHVGRRDYSPSGGGLGIQTTKITYATRPRVDKSAPTTNASRTRVGETPKYSASPPATPNIHFFLLLTNRLFTTAPHMNYARGAPPGLPLKTGTRSDVRTPTKGTIRELFDYVKSPCTCAYAKSPRGLFYVRQRTPAVAPSSRTTAVRSYGCSRGGLGFVRNSVHSLLI